MAHRCTKTSSAHLEPTKRSFRKFTAEKVIYPRRVTTLSGSPPFSGGALLGKAEAKRLRQMVFGATLAPPRQEWLKGGFRFLSRGGSIGYGLQAPQVLTQPLVMAVQTRVIKNLLFQPRSADTDIDVLLTPRRCEQQTSLASALSGILWQSRSAGSCYVCLCGEAPQVWGGPDYLPDGVTERVQYWEFCKEEDLHDFISTYLKEFESPEGSGCLLLLYSLVLSRSINRVFDDLAGVQPALLSAVGCVTPALTTLVLTGQATPYLHNGTPRSPLELNSKSAHHGVTERSEVGFLLYEETEDGRQGRQVGSRLKTPLLPIWLTCCQERYGVLFHLNRDLTRDYHAEHRFDLHYYSGHEEHLGQPTLLTVDTNSRLEHREDTLPLLDTLIHSKWPEAAIDWHGTAPYL